MKKMESFKSFEISKNSMNQIAGARTIDYNMNGERCFKYKDSNDGRIKKVVHHPRFEGRC